MAELRFNYNIQCMKLLHELKVAFPSVPDEVVRNCMKKHGNDKSRCLQELGSQGQDFLRGRYKSRLRSRVPERRYSVDTLALARHYTDAVQQAAVVHNGSRGANRAHGARRGSKSRSPDVRTVSKPWVTSRKSARRNSCCGSTWTVTAQELTRKQLTAQAAICQESRSKARHEKERTQQSKDGGCPVRRLSQPMESQSLTKGEPITIDIPQDGSYSTTLSQPIRCQGGKIKETTKKDVHQEQNKRECEIENTSPPKKLARSESSGNPNPHLNMESLVLEELSTNLIMDRVARQQQPLSLVVDRVNDCPREAQAGFALYLSSMVPTTSQQQDRTVELSSESDRVEAIQIQSESQSDLVLDNGPLLVDKENNCIVSKTTNLATPSPSRRANLRIAESKGDEIKTGHEAAEGTQGDKCSRPGEGQRQAGGRGKGLSKRSTKLPGPLALNKISDLETIPTVVLTPDSPPKDSGGCREVQTLYSGGTRLTHTLYSPDETDFVVANDPREASIDEVEENNFSQALQADFQSLSNLSAVLDDSQAPTQYSGESRPSPLLENAPTTFQCKTADCPLESAGHHVLSAVNMADSCLAAAGGRDAVSLEGHLADCVEGLGPGMAVLTPSLDGEQHGKDHPTVLVCGSNRVITQTCLDILPGMDSVTLPFGAASVSSRGDDDEEHTDVAPPMVTKTTTTITQGTLHFLKNAGNGTLSLATTTFCGIHRSVVSSTVSDNGSESGKCAGSSTTVIYSVSCKPRVCENPFRKVFARRKQFYQAREKGTHSTSPETSSRRLVWRPCSHGTCRRRSRCSDNIVSAHQPSSDVDMQAASSSASTPTSDLVFDEGILTPTASEEMMDTTCHEPPAHDQCKNPPNNCCCCSNRWQNTSGCCSSAAAPRTQIHSDAASSPTSALAAPAPRFFTLNANIQPFDAFSIRHDLSPANKLSPACRSGRSCCKSNSTCCCGGNKSGHATASRLDENDESQPCCASVNLTVCHPLGGLNSEAGDDLRGRLPVEVLPDGQGLKYTSRVELPGEGAEACLEVTVQKDSSVITTKRRAGSDCTSNEISVQLLDGGSRVNIQQSQILLPVTDVPRTGQPASRPASLHLAASGVSSPAIPAYLHTKYATVRPQSLYHQGPAGGGSSPMSANPYVPRYSSLPNLKGMVGYGDYAQAGDTWTYQSHPRDEEKRIAYTRALLTHQLEQLFKLERSLRQEREDRDLLRGEVRDIEEKWSRINRLTQKNMVQTEVKQLEKDITDLRGECGSMSEKVTMLTGGKVPLGETSINFESYLSNDQPLPMPGVISQPAAGVESTDGPEEKGRWSCTECTFSDHPSLDTCEICEMPRIDAAASSGRSRASDGCFCHPPGVVEAAAASRQPVIRPHLNYTGKVFSSAKAKPANPRNPKLTTNTSTNPGKDKDKAKNKL